MQIKTVTYRLVANINEHRTETIEATIEVKPEDNIDIVRIGLARWARRLFVGAIYENTANLEEEVTLQ